MSILLDVQHLSKTFYSTHGATEALDDISFQLNEGEFLGIVGPSGCGKSTLLDLLTGLEKPSAGDININSTLFQNNDYPIGYMFQHDHLFNWRTIESNVCLGLEVQGLLTAENKQYIDSLLDDYGLGDFRQHYPNQISGGMRQRAALIRTLALKPEILLLDEPFSALDYQTRLNLSNEVWHILRKEKKSTILITHDITEAISMCDRILLLSPRPANIHKDIPIHFDTSVPSPLIVRELPQFQSYYTMIWKEINHES